MRVTRSSIVPNRISNFLRSRAMWIAMLAAMLFGLLVSDRLMAQEAKWIWIAEQEQGMVPVGSGHFRKTFTLNNPMIGEMVIAADDEFQVYFNNELVGYGNGYDELTKIDLTRQLKDGKNVLAIRATNTEGDTAAVSAIIRFRLDGETAWRWLATDETWKSATTVMPSWKFRSFNDQRWPKVKSVGAFGKSQPWDVSRMKPSTENATSTAAAEPKMLTPRAATQSAPKSGVPPQVATTPTTNSGLPPRKVNETNASPQVGAPQVAASSTPSENLPSQNEQRAAKSAPPTQTSVPTRTASSIKNKVKPKKFDVPDNFRVDQIIDGSVGSLIALEFNEFGQMLISREGGKLLLADISNTEDGKISIRKYCDQIENIQGILPLNGQVYVTGSGSEGTGLYRLADSDRDGMLEVEQKLVSFKGPPSEHGPHGIALGPDGMIYVTVGNASAIADEVHPSSPITHIHEGEVLPRMQDPGGHAVGVKAPGGTILRISPDGTRKEIFAAGLRNAYDLAFDRKGELFFHDSDMESDVGTPWYRPTQVFHAVAGGEYGWRSGTAKFPSYFIDNIPGLVGTDRGSPTGAVVYDHVMMPIRYHGALFLGDWSEGRIIAVKLKEQGDSYVAEASNFLTADSLTVTDLAVGPDGAIYFTTGGRGTEGGVYRITWKGTVPEEFRILKDTLRKLVGRPQPQSAWTRQELAKLQVEMGPQWSNQLQTIAMQRTQKPEHRIRALEIMNLYGPAPSDQLLTVLGSDTDPLVRRRAIQSIGWREASESYKQIVINALTDQDGRVRRAACESARHMGITVPLQQLEPALRSSSRTEALAARRLLESQPIENWKQSILQHEDLHVYLQGSTALMIVQPELSNSYEVLAKCSTLMDGFISDSDFVDLLRVMQLALTQGNVDSTKIPLFKDRMLAEFPSMDGTINREVSRIIGYLQDARVGQSVIEYLAGPDADRDKLQVALNFRNLADQFTAEQRLAVVKFLETMATAPAAAQSNYGLYISNILDEWSGEIEDSQIAEILQNGAKYPTAALSAFYKLPNELNEQHVEWITEMDRQLMGRTEAAAKKARVGCIAVLGRSGDEKSMTYLREIWRVEEDRRDDVALALSQQPDGENWPYLVSSLGELRDDTASEILVKLASVNKRPDEARYFRDTITAGYRLRESGAIAADKLLTHWTGNKIAGEGHSWQILMRAWAKWFNDLYPNEEPISFDDQAKVGKYSVDELLTFIEANQHATMSHNGMLTFNKAQCANCHRHNGNGESLGPELSSLAKRFSKRETLRAILHPSEHISSQYAAKKILTVDGEQLIGLVTELDNGDFLVLDSEGEKVNLPANDVEEMVEAKVSAMPEGLLDNFSKEDIRDLLGYLYQRDANSSASAAATQRR